MCPCRPVPVQWLAALLLLAVPLDAAAQTQPNVAPTSHDFENVGVGTISLAEPITVYNEDGASALQVTGGSLSGPNANQFRFEPAITSHSVPVGQNEITTLV